MGAPSALIQIWLNDKLVDALVVPPTGFGPNIIYDKPICFNSTIKLRGVPSWLPGEDDWIFIPQYNSTYNTDVPGTWTRMQVNGIGHDGVYKSLPGVDSITYKIDNPLFIGRTIPFSYLRTGYLRGLTSLHINYYVILELRNIVRCEGDVGEDLPPIGNDPIISIDIPNPCSPQCLIENVTISNLAIKYFTDNFGNKHIIPNGPIKFECATKSTLNDNMCLKIKSYLRGLAGCNGTNAEVSWVSSGETLHCVKLIITNSPVKFNSVTMSNGYKFTFDTTYC